MESCSQDPLTKCSFTKKFPVRYALMITYESDVAEHISFQNSTIISWMQGFFFIVNGVKFGELWAGWHPRVLEIEYITNAML